MASAEAALAVPMDAPDTTGRIRQLAGLPMATLQPGLYTLRLTVLQGLTRQVRDAIVTIID